ncbi:S8 family peptidase [Sphaerimonospora thailandensis]|uniref:Serine protease n=1 Tax=Sphaerimonospora thailandensis TaxID=795644 RepID=A0A8J3RF41_9ACTN|nr:S8 family peptidase [Sphaerimonospora thailandensis]GIH73116.1 serine protease [Sphaerimonospora thailandensis]
MRNTPNPRRVALAALVTAGTAVAGLAITAPAQADPVKIRSAAEPVPGSYIVAFKDETARPGVTSDRANELARKYNGKIKFVYTAGLRGFAVKMSENDALRLAADPAVAYVQRDGTAHIADTQNNATWGIDRIDQRNLPLNQTYTYSAKAENVTAYIVDTGIYKDHRDYGGRASYGYDFIDNDSTPQDCHGHGTHVAGTVGSNTYGVAKGVKLVGVRVLNCQGTGEWSQIIAGIDWVVKNAARPAVVNMSIGGGADTSVDNAVKQAVDAGITMVVAAGNDSANACNYSPARAPSAITVGATDSRDTRSSFSNHGSCLDIFAPGSSILSTSNSGGTATMSGTSMASPHVAGAAALYLSGNPSATPAQVAQALVANATPNVVSSPGSGSPNKLLYTGFIGGGGPSPSPSPTPNPPNCSGGSNGDDVSIPDAGSAVTSPLTLSGCSGKGTTTTGVKVDIVHSYTGDLVIDLVGPSGAVYNLKQAGGVGSADGVHQTFTVNTSAEDRDGTWKLQVHDVYSYDVGKIDSWSISF